MSRRLWPLKVEAERDEGAGPVLGYWSRGHHDRAAFAAAVAPDYLDHCDVGSVEYRYWRTVPAAGLLWIHDSSPGPGAFPVTYIRVR